MPPRHEQARHTTHQGTESASSPFESGRTFGLAFPNGVRQMWQSANSISRPLKSLWSSHFLFYRSWLLWKASTTVRPSCCEKAYTSLMVGPVEENEGIGQQPELGPHIKYRMSWDISDSQPLQSQQLRPHTWWSGDKALPVFCPNF